MSEPESMIAENPATGMLESFPVDAVPLVPAGAVPIGGAPITPPTVRATGVMLQPILGMDDESTPDTYEAVVSLHGLAVNVDLLDDVEYAEYRAGEKELGQMLVNMSKDASADDDPTNAYTVAQTAFCDRVIRKQFKGVNGQRVGVEKPLRWFLHNKVRLCDLIVQKSRIGRNDTDFSAGS